jgi:GTP-binding protein
VLLHVLDLGPDTGRTPAEDFAAINAELREYSPELAARPQIVVANKIDLPEAGRRLPEVRRLCEGARLPLVAISAVTGEGIPELIRAVTQHLVGTTWAAAS